MGTALLTVGTIVLWGLVLIGIGTAVEELMVRLRRGLRRRAPEA